MVVKIIYTMSNGKQFEKTRGSYGNVKPFKDATAAQVDLELCLQNLMYFAVDDGEIVVCGHIASARIVEG